MMGIDISKIYSQFIHDKQDSSRTFQWAYDNSFFFFIFIGLLLFLFLAQKDRRLRWALLTGFSFYFYYKAIGYLPYVLLISTIVNYGLGKVLIKDYKEVLKKAALIFGVIFNVGALGYYKYTNFLFSAFANFKGQEYTPLAIIIPMGISYFSFKALSYLFDIYYGSLEKEYSFSDFLLYMVFFPSVMQGPIDKSRDFLPQIDNDYHLDREGAAKGIFLIMSGLIKKVVIADYLRFFLVERVMESPDRFTGVEILIAIYGYAIYIYCNFSGFTDMGIGIAQLMGFKLTDNFNFPYKAKSVAEFWRRWHMSLSSWLQEYLFVPLQMSMRTLRLMGNVLAVFITFVICGVWHGASWNFIIWGALHAFFMAFALAIKKPKENFYKLIRIDRLVKTKAWGVLQVIFTFHLICFTWIVFSIPDLKIIPYGIQMTNNFTFYINIPDSVVMHQMYDQMTMFFKANVFWQFIAAYPMIMVLLVSAFVLHYIPASVYTKAEYYFSKLPIVVQAQVLTLVIWIVTQSRFADSPPPIYFNF